MMKLRAAIIGLLISTSMLSLGARQGQLARAADGHSNTRGDGNVPPLHSETASEVIDQGKVDPNALIATWIAEAIPPRYEKKEDWGRTRRITVGIEARSRGLNIRLRPKKKQVPHGIWKHYRLSATHADAIDVEHTDLRVLQPGRVAGTVHVSVPIHGWGRMRIYQHGLHLGTYTAEGRSDVRIHIAYEVGLRLDGDQGIPTVILDPHVQHARLDLRDFQLARISNADGPVVRELGRGLKHIVQEELEPRTLTKKLNRAISKKRDRLRWQLQQLVHKEWAELIAIALPAATP